MEYFKEDVFAYQILEILVGEYQYKIVNVPGNKRDLWVANEKNLIYPLIRINSVSASSIEHDRDYVEMITSSLSNVLQMEYLPLLIINTNEASTSFVDGNVEQVILTNTMLTNSSIYTVFPKLNGYLHIVSDCKAECHRITKHIGEIGRNKAKQYSKEHWRELPFASIALIVVGAIFSLALTYVFRSWEHLESLYVLFGAYSKSVIYYGHEYFRLLTSILCHRTIIDVMVNGIAIYSIGRIFEHKIGAFKYLLIFFVSVLVSNMFTYICNSNVIVMGMGPGIVGVGAACLVYLLTNPMNRNNGIFGRQVQIAGLGVFICSLNGMTFVGVLGAAIAGIFMGMAMVSGRKYKSMQKHFLICGILLVGMLGIFMTRVQDCYPVHEDINNKFIEVYQHVGFDFEADRLKEVLPLGE